MTPKQRIMASLRGLETDRVAWSPFLAYWWDAQPEALQKRGQLAFMKEIGADPLLRGFHTLFRKDYDYSKVAIREKTDGDKKYIIYDTAAGTLTECHTYVSQANTWYLTEHPVKTKNDWKTLAFIYENMRIIPDSAGFKDDVKVLGEEGLYVPAIGTEYKTCFQGLVEHWVGTEELAYALADTPELVGDCLNVMKQRALETVKASLETDAAEAFIFWEDSSTTNISPAFFEKYAAPEISEWAKLIHEENRLIIHHACGHIKDLLPYMAKTGIDAIESVSPPPTGNIEIWDAAANLPDGIALIGGIEPVNFLKLSSPELEKYAGDLLSRMKDIKRRGYILANSDSCPPGVAVEKFKLISDIVKRM